ncbi:MAG: hypothetical protein HYU86_01005 [Chloroflexi bacterium]|nr:hypothetical protein [Chloroflexota bacterium]
MPGDTWHPNNPTKAIRDAHSFSYLYRYRYTQSYAHLPSDSRAHFNTDRYAGTCATDAYSETNGHVDNYACTTPATPQWQCGLSGGRRKNFLRSGLHRLPYREGHRGEGRP